MILRTRPKMETNGQRKTETEFCFTEREYRKLEHLILKARQSLSKGDKGSANQNLKHVLAIMEADTMRFYDKNLNPYTGKEEEEDLNDFFG